LHTRHCRIICINEGNHEPPHAHPKSNDQYRTAGPKITLLRRDAALGRIGWANVSAASTAPGTPLTVACPDGDRNAMVVKAPWFPAEKIIPEGIGQG